MRAFRCRDAYLRNRLDLSNLLLLGFQSFFFVFDKLMQMFAYISFSLKISSFFRLVWLVFLIVAYRIILDGRKQFRYYFNTVCNYPLFLLYDCFLQQTSSVFTRTLVLVFSLTISFTAKNLAVNRIKLDF